MILDTNALSVFLKKDPAILRYVGDAEEFCVPVIVLGEYRYGLSGSRGVAGSGARDAA